MRLRRIAALSGVLLVAAVLFLASRARADIDAVAASAEGGEQQRLASSSAATAKAATASSAAPVASSNPTSSSSRPIPTAPLTRTTIAHRRSLKCDVSTVSLSAEQVIAGSNASASGNKNNNTNSTTKRSKADLFRIDNSSALFNASTGGAINDMCSQALPVVEANVTDPLDNREVLHARPWTENEIVSTALRRRGRRVAAGALTEFDLAAASPLLLPSLIRYRPLSDSAFGDEVARVMAVFHDGEIPADSSINGLPRSVAALESVVSSKEDGAKVRRTISPQGLRNILAKPELVLLAMAAANRTLPPGIADAAKNLRISKEEYRAFLTRDGDVDVCEDLTLVGDVVAPVDRLFAAADIDKDGFLDAAEVRKANLTDAASVWIQAGDTDGDGMLSTQELADGLPQYGDLQPRGGTQRATPEQLRRIRETAALAAVAAYDVESDGQLTLEEMRVYSSDFTRRSMGQTMVPVWAFSWHVAQIAVNDTLESLHLQQEQAISQLTEWKGPKAAIAATEQHQKDKNTKKPSSDEKENKFPSLLTPRNTNASALSNSSTSLYAASSFDDSAALRSFMLSHANFSMTARAALAAAAAAGMSYASGSAADLAPGFDMWSRGSDPGLTQKEWVDFYAALHRTAARAYWTIGKRAGAGAVAPECCGVLAPGLIEIAKILPLQMGQAAISLPPARAEADAVRFDCDGDGVEVEAGGSSSGGGGSNNNGTAASASGSNEAALTHVDILEWGILRLGTLCDALPPVKAMGH